VARVNEGSYSFTTNCNPYSLFHKWNEPAFPHFGRYSFPIKLMVGGWVGLSEWLHTKTVYLWIVANPDVISLMRPTPLPLYAKPPYKPGRRSVVTKGAACSLWSLWRSLMLQLTSEPQNCTVNLALATYRRLSVNTSFSSKRSTVPSPFLSKTRKAFLSSSSSWSKLFLFLATISQNSSNSSFPLSFAVAKTYDNNNY